MDNEFENIVPWNGANDTGRDVRLKWQRNFERIKANFEEVLKLLGEVDVEKLAKYFIRKDKEDETEYIVKFLSGLEVGEFIDSLSAGKGTKLFSDGRGQMNILELRKQIQIGEAILFWDDTNKGIGVKRASSPASEDGTGEVKENEIGIYSLGWMSAKGIDKGEEEGSGAGSTTIGGLTNVGSWADQTADYDRIMVQIAGSNTWTEKRLDEIGGGLDEEQLAAYLTENNYAKIVDIPSLDGYATQSWVLGKGYATTSDLDSRIDALVNGAPAAFDTLKEIADVLQGNVDSIGDILTTLGTKADKSISILAGTGLAGGGTLSANRTLSLKPATTSALGGIIVGDRLSVDSSGRLTATYTYTHPSATATTIAAATGKVLSAITVNSLGHVTSVAAKTLAAADIPSLAISKITGLQDELDKKLDASVLNDLFEKVTVNGVTAIRAKYGLFTNEFLSAKGMDEGEEGGSGSSYLSDLLDVSLTSLATNDLLKWNGTKWINVPQSSIVPSLVWGNITGKPTTLAGYGITDAYKVSAGDPDNLLQMSAGYYANVGSYASFVQMDYGGQLAFYAGGILKFRGVNRNVVGAWKTVLDSTNYASTLDSRYLLFSTYTASDILEKLKTVDGSGTGLDADLLDGYHAENFYANGYVMFPYSIDASSLDENTYYPVTINLGTQRNVRIECIVSLNSGTKPSWATHSSGFSVRKIWESNGSGWGISNINRRILVSDYLHASSDPVLGIGQLTNSSNEYVYVRGGGKYSFYISHGVKPVLQTSTYTVNSQSVSPTTTPPALITRNVAFITDNVASATRLQTARTFWGQSFDGTNNVSGSLTGVTSIIASSFITTTGTITGQNLVASNGKLQSTASGKTITIYSENNQWCHYRTDAENGHWFGNDVTIQGALEPYNGTQNFGSSTARWNVFGVNGNFSASVSIGMSLSVSGLITANSGLHTPQYLQVGDGRIYWDATNKALYVKGSDGTAIGFYSNGWMSAKGVDEGEESGSSGDGMTEKQMWEYLADAGTEQIALNHLTTALTGYATQSWVNSQGFLTSIPTHNHSWANITSGKPSTLSGYGITDGVNTITISGSGNAVSDITLSGHTLTVKKTNISGSGSTGGVTAINISGSGNAVTTANLSGNTLTLTKGSNFLLATGNAASASKLQTSRTFWGQSFDGTNNVQGAMSNVDWITLSRGTSNRYLELTNEGSIIFHGGSSNWIMGLVSNGYNGTNLGNPAASYGSGNSLIYHYYGGTYTSPIMIINSSGNVGIGTTSPAAKLHVNGLISITQNNNTVTIGSQNSNFCHIYNSADLPFLFNKSVLTTGGDLGSSQYRFTNLYLSGSANAATLNIGSTATIAGQLNLGTTYRQVYSGSAQGSVVHRILNYPASAFGLLTRIYSNGNVSLQVQREANDSECFNLLLNHAGGNVGIGTTSPTAKLHVNGNIAASNVSDLRLKTIIDKKTDYRRKLMGLGQVVDFYYNDKAFSRKIGEVDKEKHIGLIYQSAIKMELSKFCHMEEDGYGSINYLSADYINLIAGALQQTIGIQEDIVQRVIRLEKENEELKCKLNRLLA